MPLNDRQLKNAKPKDKLYKLADGINPTAAKQEAKQQKIIATQNTFGKIAKE